MAMILGVGGSPRKKGNSDVMLHRILNAAKEQGATVEEVHLRDYAFSSCIGCEKCRVDKCCTGVRDGMQLLYPKVERAHALVLASPAHNYNVSALMKGFIDRLYAYFDFSNDHPRKYTSRLGGMGRVAGFAGVCEQTEPDDLGFTIEGMRRPLAALGYESLGQVAAFGVFHVGRVKQQEHAMRHCDALGQELAKNAMAMRDAVEKALKDEQDKGKGGMEELGEDEVTDDGGNREE